MKFEKELKFISEENEMRCNIINDKLYMFKGKRIKAIQLPKNTTIEWINKQVDKFTCNTYKNLRTVFENLNIKGDIYYTTFGFSYDMFMKFGDKFESDVSIIEKALKANDIPYRCEFSDARWVYRFRISQSKEVLDRVRQL